MKTKMKYLMETILHQIFSMPFASLNLGGISMVLGLVTLVFFPKVRHYLRPHDHVMACKDGGGQGLGTALTVPDYVMSLIKGKSPKSPDTILNEVRSKIHPLLACPHSRYVAHLCHALFLLSQVWIHCLVVLDDCGPATLILEICQAAVFANCRFRMKHFEEAVLAAISSDLYLRFVVLESAVKGGGYTHEGSQGFLGFL